MNTKISKGMLLLGFTVMMSATAFAQETKVKIERDNYEMKAKREGNEYKVKEKGERPMPAASRTIKEKVTYKQGETMTTVKHGEMQKQVAKKKTYAAKKNCTCKTSVAKRPVRRTHAVAHHAKRPIAHRRTTAVAKAKVATPMLVRDTVYVTRVDTVVRVMESASFTGNRTPKYMMDNFKKLKIERENDGEIELKKEYEDGSEIKKTFDNEHDFQTYMQWKNF
jgi:hypothetical protein